MVAERSKGVRGANLSKNQDADCVHAAPIVEPVTQQGLGDFGTPTPLIS